MTSLCKRVVFPGKLNPDVPSSECFSTERRSPRPIEWIEHNLSFVSKRGNKAPHERRWELARMVDASRVVFEAVDVPPKVCDWLAVWPLQSTRLHAPFTETVPLPHCCERLRLDRAPTALSKPGERSWTSLREANNCVMGRHDHPHRET